MDIVTFMAWVDFIGAFWPLLLAVGLAVLVWPLMAGGDWYIKRAMKDLAAEEVEIPHQCACPNCQAVLGPHGPRRHPLRHVGVRFGEIIDSVTVVTLNGVRIDNAIEAFEGNPGWVIRLSDFGGPHTCYVCNVRRTLGSQKSAGLCTEMIFGDVRLEQRPAATPAMSGAHRVVRPAAINDPPEAAT